MTFTLTCGFRFQKVKDHFHVKHTDWHDIVCNVKVCASYCMAAKDV